MISHLAAAFLFLSSGITAYLWVSRLRLPSAAAKVLCGIVVWELLQVIPVQVFAALEIAGITGRMNLTVLAALQAALFVGSAAWLFIRPRQSATIPCASSSLPLRSRYTCPAIAVLAVSYAIFAIDRVTSFPTGPDALVYHLPLALRWLQNGSLAIPASRAWRFSLSGNAEIGMMLLMATGRQWSVIFVGWIAIAALVLATYRLASRMSDGDPYAPATVTIILLSVPIVEFQTFSAYVDLFGTAFLAAAVALLLYARNHTEQGQLYYSPAILFLAAAACGVSLGTKAIYYVYVAAFVLITGFIISRDLYHQRKKLLRCVCVLIVGILLPSVFWFARGFHATSNPLFPLQVRIANHVVFQGLTPAQMAGADFDENFVQNRSDWLLYPWTEWKRHTGYMLIPYSEGSGLGALFASIVPIGLAFLLCQSFVAPGEGFRNWFLLLLFGMFVLVWWFVMLRVPRYGLPIILLACLLSTPLVAFLHRHWNRAFRILLLASLAITCMISSFVPLRDLLGRVRTGKWTRAEFYGYPPVIDRLPRGSQVLNWTGSEENNFALSGRELTNLVVPPFEVTNLPTRNLLLQDHVAYIAEIANGNEKGDWSAQFVPFSTAVVKSPDGPVIWRIWKIE